jgi:hypothetical protein
MFPTARPISTGTVETPRVNDKIVTMLEYPTPEAILWERGQNPAFDTRPSEQQNALEINQCNVPEVAIGERKYWKGM